MPVTLLLGGLGSMLYGFGEESSDTAVAESADFTVISYEKSGFFSSGTIGLRLRSKEGLASYRSGENPGMLHRGDLRCRSGAAVRQDRVRNRRCILSGLA